MKSKKLFFNFDKNDENKNVDDEKSNANENNLFDDMNENEKKKILLKTFKRKKTR